MDVITNLALGFGEAVTPLNLLIALAGCIVGTAVGVLPGLGPTATISLLLPISVYLDKTSAIILLSGIYYGAMYGGSITSILVKIPGEAASVITCIDGYQMARKGRAGAALTIAALGSFFAGIVATLGIALIGPVTAQLALAFGPIEKTSLLILGFTLVLGVGEGSRIRALAMIGLGLLMATVGVDLVSGDERFVFDVAALRDGFNIAILAMGLFGISEVLLMAEEKDADVNAVPTPRRLRDLFPNRQEARESAAPVVRGSILGFFLGLLPGGGALIASFASYMLERKLSRHPEEFGKGAVPGVAGPESANNAGAQASFVPLLCLGIPANATIGVIMGALLMAGVTPGPRLITDHPEMFWGVVASMFVGNAILVILNVPLVGLFVSLLRVPRPVMSVLILFFCVIGAYSLNNNMFDVGAMFVFGALGYGLRKSGFDVAPLLLAFVLGRLFEESLMQGLIVGHGQVLAFIASPLSAFFLAAAVLILVLPPVVAKLRRGPSELWQSGAKE
ncbi:MULTISPECIES: tripartite tricarboxylate transporter permease [unclassified Chelatococcus]|uniref:tripartite tricarboxylate transporter permease n=1 Tax=unclassified Chelatococcus TaxID=2638111 RepID=UPI001BCC0B07|nr:MULTISPECIES: tripartite tricarboxylate transporter permease [unclassified Chelatococcus]MBS7700409.1 tripartite tricarboxylate transporter permease [Chelatococcus sp. YT9]MBX3556205.1 tripartite tricarboxylate transporter permease [Chelatococcus sp.]